MRRRVELWTRTDEGWAYCVAAEGDVIELASMGASLDVSQLYDAAAAPEA
jgi:hypothetical protein